MDEGKAFLALCAISVFLAAGCALNVPANDRLTLHNITPNYTDRSQLICQGMNVSHPCWCMFCENKTSWTSIFSIFSSRFDATLESGNCSFTMCNVTGANATLKENDNVQLREVAVGAGPSFVAADRANRYCNNSLQLTTKWMKGLHAPPAVPNATRAGCWLRQNALPIFIYYTNSTYISPNRMLDIANEFQRDGGVGPAIVTTEIGFNSSNDPQVLAVKNQIIALDACEKCLTVLAIKPGDYTALNKILRDNLLYVTPTGAMKTMQEMVDVVGFGFRNTDYTNCSTAQIMYDNFLFSRTVLITYSKPTLWLYVGLSEGKSYDGSCEWSDTKVHDFYQNLFSVTDAMSSSGVMGFSIYEFTDGRGPLPCNGVQGCNFGLFNYDGTQKHPELNTWATDCQYFGTQQYRSAMIYSRNGYGKQCEAWKNTDIYNVLSTEINIPSDRLDESYVSRSPKLSKTRCGEVCVSNNPIPDDAYGNSGVGIYDSVSGVHFRSDLCSEYNDLEVYPEIDEIADDEDVAMNYMRALFQRDNPIFREAEVFCVNATNMSCNLDSKSMSEICMMSGIDPIDCPTDCPAAWQKPCMFGLALCKEYPGAYYVNTGRPVPDSIRDCGGANYNPFIPTMSVCCGTKKFRRSLDTARQFVNNNWLTLSTIACMGGLQDTDKDWASYYVATMLYRNESFDLAADLANFVVQRDIDSGGQCVGDENYIRYTRQYSNYTAAVMTNYLSAIGMCDSDCPGG